MDIDKIKSLLRGENSLYNSTLKTFNIELNGNNEMVVELNFTNFSPKSSFSEVKLIFSGIIEISIFHSEEYNFNTIEDYKLLTLEDGNVFISLDPNDSVIGFSKQDGDYVKAKNIKMSMKNKQ